MGHFKEVFFIGFLLLILLGVVFLSAQSMKGNDPLAPFAPFIGKTSFNGKKVTPAPDSNPPVQQKMRAGENALYVPDQKPGREVIVPMVVFADSGFVVIQRDNRIIGKSNIIAGNEQQIIIELSEEVKDGDILLALLYEDDGDRSFSPSNDMPAKDTLGSNIQMQFRISPDAEDVGAIAF